MTTSAAQIARWREDAVAFVREVIGVEPDAWQREVLIAVSRGDMRIAMQACKGPGKLQPKSMLLDTPDGLRRWGDLRAGDRVFAVDGSATRIVRCFDNGVVDQFRVWFDDGSSTLCGAEHLWRVRGHNERSRVGFKSGRSEEWVTLTTAEIIARGVRSKNGRWAQRQFEIPRHGAVQLPHAVLPVDPYMMGVWLGDGTRRTGHYTNIDPEVETEIVRRGYQIGARRKQGRNVLGLVTQLRVAGVLDLGSPNRYVPDVFKRASIAQRIDLLRGLMDTDGTVGRDAHMEYATTSRRLADDVVWLVRSLGGVAFIKDSIKKPFYYGKKREKIVGRDCYRVTVRTDFSPFLIERKTARFVPPTNKSRTRYLTRYIDRIEPAPAEDSMCIEIEHPSRCYLANDFIVTHNTAVLSWIAWWFLLTRPHPKIAATSVSSQNLADCLWAEMAVWQAKAPILKAAFEWTKTRISSKQHPETWFMTARSWAKGAAKDEQANTLAGLHSDFMMFLIDEAGAVPDSVMAAAEAGLANARADGREAFLVIAGNPTHLSGPLYRAATKERKMWTLFEITADPESPVRTPRVSIEWAREQIQKYGVDNPWVLVNVFGRFPQTSINALLSEDDVNAAMDRFMQPHQIAPFPRILGVDVAREGLDLSVIFPRQGKQAFPPQVYRNIDGLVGAGEVARKWQDWQADACFIDSTGGFGASWIDQLRALSFAPIGVHFSISAGDKQRYANKRAEMYFLCAQWIKEGGCLPRVPELVQELAATTYTHRGDALLLEDKDQIKAKIGRSPDYADALALTFASPVNKAVSPTLDALLGGFTGGRNARHTYDPFRPQRRSETPPPRIHWRTTS